MSAEFGLIFTTFLTGCDKANDKKPLAQIAR